MTMGYQLEVAARRHVDLPERTWPDHVVEKRRSGARPTFANSNQALVNPMDIRAETALFDLSSARRQEDGGSVSPSLRRRTSTRPASCRGRPDPGRHDDRRPDAGAARADRADLEAIDGARRAIVHLYTRPRSPSAASSSARRGRIAELACAARRLPASSPRRATEDGLPVPPESFHGTELDYALEISEAVVAECAVAATTKIIVNLPRRSRSSRRTSTPTASSGSAPRLARRRAIISVHPHNDRGTAVATADSA